MLHLHIVQLQNFSQIWYCSYVHLCTYPCMTLCVDIACKVIYYGAGQLCISLCACRQWFILGQQYQEGTIYSKFGGQRSEDMSLHMLYSRSVWQEENFCEFNTVSFGKKNCDKVVISLQGCIRRKYLADFGLLKCCSFAEFAT